MSRRVLIVNVYFAPTSFGGATIVAEEMAERLAGQHGWSVSAFTSMQAGHLPDFSIRRYRARAADVVAVSLPGVFTYTEQYLSPRVRTRFAEMLDAFAPHVVHLHCVQTLGADLIDEIRARHIPFAVTLHDCWWLCERQFMIDALGHYCFQEKISPDRCRYCVDDHQASVRRAAYLHEQLSKADRLIFPSAFQRDLYIANGFAAERCVVNKNGVRPPSSGYRRRQAGGAPVFGFIGGPGHIKGGDIIVRALQLLGRDDIHLKVVDAAQNVGTSWQRDGYWNVPCTVEHIPAYTRETMDAFYASIDVLLFPSQWKESFGLTVREALLRDVWVIATDAGGVSEDLVAGDNASLLPLDGRHAPLAEAIADCLKRSDWAEYRNPHKATVTTLDRQAAELSNLLDAIAQV
ncbi:glycosyltransferase family 4 protein [Fontimonas sp. SYSU GA230001]|uniref:glycosyltransferase family 4 protein n=1 Tax=Fontimonas sp. SYSU GA230001 TaxID=3142450 RepID=UPI0032B4187F